MTLVLGLGSVLVLAASLAWTPAEWGAGAPQAWLGLEAQPCSGCALCGLSRAFAFASRGELGRALAHNPLVVPAYLAALSLAAGVPFAVRVLLRRRRSRPCAS